MKYLRISRVQNSGGKHAWVRSQAGDRVQRTKKRVPEKFRGSWKGKWNARIRGMPTVRLAISYLLALSCRISAVQHTAKLSFSSPFSSLPRRGIFRGVSRRSNTLEPGENYCILKRKQ